MSILLIPFSLPLLLQSHDRFTVCGTMVEAAAHWINAGLPLRCFKIVIYEGVDEKVKTLFQGMKKRLMAKNAKMKVTDYR